MASKPLFLFSTIHKQFIFKSLRILLCSQIALFIMFLSMNCVRCLTCSSSSITNTIASEDFTYSGYTESYAYGAVLGTTSSSIYYLHRIVSPGYNSVVRKINSINSVEWMTAFSLNPSIKGLSIDKNEQHVYIISWATVLKVCRLTTNSGSIVDGQKFSNLDAESDDIRIHILSDDSGYYVFGQDSSSIANICKYLFASTSTAQCQSIPNFQSFAFGALKLSDTSFFVLSNSPSTFSLHIYKLTFSSSSPDWSSKLLCSSSPCSTDYSESLLSSSSIYSFIPFGNPKYVYFIVFSLADGTASSRYKSTKSFNYVYGSAISGDYVIASTGSYLIVFNKAKEEFVLKKTKDVYIYAVVEDFRTARILITGMNGTIGYISKFKIQSIPAHPNFQVDNSWSMNALASGTEEITSESGQIIGSITTQIVLFQTFTNMTVIYVSGTSYTSDVNFLTDDQSFSMIENTSSQKTPDLTCSNSGLTSISFSIAGYSSSTPPSYVTIDTTTGKLNITAPDVTADTEFNFYINSILSGVTDTIQKRIKLSVNNCSVPNCKICLSTSNTICDICNSGSASPSEALVTTSDTAKAFTSTSISLVFATSGCLVFTNFLNTSSIATLWLIINQLQIFMLLTLSRTYIPQDIKGFITGSKFALNIFEYIPFKRLNIYPSFLNMFEFGTVNSSFDSFGIHYESTIINSYSFFACFIFIIILHVITLLLRFLFLKCSENWFIKLMKFLTQKGYDFLTFGYYIRSVLEISQCILISSIHEVYFINTTEINRSISFAFACMMIVCYILVLCTTSILIFSNYKLNEKEHNKLEELFRSLQENKRSRFYISVLLFRRLLFVTILITLIVISSRNVMYILISFQFLYYIWLIYSRPYNEFRDNFIEILNETYFSFFISILTAFSTEDEWNQTKTNITMWIVLSNSVFVFIIVIISFIKITAKCLIKKCQKNKITQERPLIVIPSPSLTPTTVNPTRITQLANNKATIKSLSIVSLNNIQEESKYAENDNLSQILVIPKKNWS